MTTSSSSFRINKDHPELLSAFDEDSLPEVYGGKSKFDLSKGLFNELGPWSMDTELVLIGEEENKFNEEEEEDEPIDDDIKTAIQGIPSFPGTGMPQNKKPMVVGKSNDVFNMEALGELINQTPNATPMNTYADDED